MAVLTPAGSIHGTGSIPPVGTGFGGGGGGGGDDRHPRFRPNLHQLGIALGLLAIAAFFGALCIAYSIVLARQAAWQRFHVPLLLWLSTGLILVSSYSLERVRYALWRGLVARSIRRFRTTLLIGNAFLVSQLLAWLDLLRQGVAMERNPHGSVFYVFTGLHGLHVAGGIVWLVFLWQRARELEPGEHPLRKLRLATGAAALYWHFMGALWVFLFILLLVWS